MLDVGPRSFPPHRGASGWRVLLRRSGAVVTTLAAVASILSVAAGFWFVSTLVRGTDPGGALGAGGLWLAVALVLGVPVALAFWKHPRKPQRALRTLAYLPVVWNTGLVLAALRLVPDLAADALVAHGAYLAARPFGDTAPQTRLLSAAGQRLAAAARTDATDPPGDPPATSVGLVVPFRASGASIVTEVTLDGPAGTVQGRYVLDTGASYTTITAAHAAALGLDVPPDAPRLEFHTAAGPVESRVVFLPALRMGGVRLDRLAVSICDDCASGDADGLLGLNVLRRFLIQTDYVRDRMILLPRTSDPARDHAFDIQAMTEVELVGPADVWLGTVHWVLRVRNRAPVPIQDVVPAVRFLDGPTLRGNPIARIEPGAAATTLVQGTVGDGDASFVLEIARARW